MAFENLLRPGYINGMYMRNRLIVGPMEKSLADLDGSLNERYIAYARRRAMGGAALIQLESTYVSPEGRGTPTRLDATAITSFRPWRGWPASSTGTAPSWPWSSTTADGRPPRRPITGGRSLRRRSPRRSWTAERSPRPMTRADIRRVVDDFARAAERCLEAGVDMIHLHGAHGYLLGQFLSPQSNRRTDGTEAPSRTGPASRSRCWRPSGAWWGRSIRSDTAYRPSNTSKAGWRRRSRPASRSCWPTPASI